MKEPVRFGEEPGRRREVVRRRRVAGKRVCGRCWQASRVFTCPGCRQQQRIAAAARDPDGTPTRCAACVTSDEDLDRFVAIACEIDDVEPLLPADAIVALEAAGATAVARPRCGDCGRVRELVAEPAWSQRICAQFDRRRHARDDDGRPVCLACYRDWRPGTSSPGYDDATPTGTPLREPPRAARRSCRRPPGSCTTVKTTASRSTPSPRPTSIVGSPTDRPLATRSAVHRLDHQARPCPGRRRGRRDEGWCYTTAPLDADECWEQARRLLHDDILDPADRVVGILVLLYAQPLARIARLTVDGLDDQPGRLTISFGEDYVLIPEPLAGLLRQLPWRRQIGPSGVAPGADLWLFPGRQAGRHIHPEHLRNRLAALGIASRPARQAALLQLSREVPAVVLADMLNIDEGTATAWAARSGGTWNRCAASRLSLDPARKGADHALT